MLPEYRGARTPACRVPIHRDASWLVALAVIPIITLMPVMSDADLPCKTSLNLAVIKAMVATAEAEDGAGLNIIQFAQKTRPRPTN